MCGVSRGAPQMVRSVSPLVDLIQDDADEQSPAGGADAEQADAGGGDDEGQQGGLPLPILLQGAVQAAAYTPTYGAPAPRPEPVQPKREPVYQNVSAPTPQRALAPEPTPTKITRKPWYLNFLVILLIILIIIGLVLTFMPASWWCFLSFNRLPGCY